MKKQTSNSQPQKSNLKRSFNDLSQKVTVASSDNQESVVKDLQIKLNNIK